MMVFTITDSTGRDTAEIEHCNIDIEIGGNTKNDLSIEIPYYIYDEAIHMPGGYLYCDGTEYGGKIMDMIEKTADKAIFFEGDTWRGMLDKKIILPPSGSSHFVLNGDITECLNTLIGGRFESLFRVAENNTGVSVSGYKVSRYATMLDAMMDLCESVGYRLELRAYGTGETVYCELSAQPITDYSDAIEVSQDNGINFTISTIRRRYTHVVAAGKGELQNRLIVYLHIFENGSYEEVDSIPDGENVVEYFYDYPSAEDKAELIKSAVAAVKELNSTNAQQVTVDNESDDYAIGDIVGGRSYVTGQVVAEPISQKVVTYKNDTLKIQYKVGK